MQTKFSLLRSAVTWLQGSRSSVHNPGHSPSATMKMACAEGRVPSYLRKHCMQSNTYLAWTFFFASTYAWFIVRNHLIWKNDQHEYKFMILWYALATFYSNSDISVTIQPPTSVKVAFTDEGGCIVTKTSEWLHTKRSWLIYLATQDSTNECKLCICASWWLK